jgi:hypothetical protein
MNSKINEFKQQAGIDYNPDQEGLDIFARLVAEECVRIARAGLAPAAAQVIKETFGLDK